ncbi:MAG: GTP cyclohydrolase II RibA [Alphaproteobacteria bacterium]|nr:GTP cyclohydrolase II RibA [Alphaproteobacteria bacterium]
MTSLSSKSRKDHLGVERALAEIRAGRPVVLHSPQQSCLVIGVDGLEPELLARLDRFNFSEQRLILPAPRLRRLGAQGSLTSHSNDPGAIALPQLDLARIETLTFKLGAKIDAPVSALQPNDQAALELMRLALVLPAAVVIKITDDALAHDTIAELDVLSVETSQILSFRADEAASLHIVSRAPVPLEGASETEFVIFRGGEGMRDQVAIVIGNPDLTKPVRVRLHSACLTGDLFGSLKCDCGDQLRSTAQFMAEHGGGVLLYLDQEGRGNGLSNKIRAYQLQTLGFDTYDADEVLGFDHDQRHFDFAASMLKQLHIQSVQVMTNNPFKIAALKEAGLEVVADERILGRKTDQNVHYLATKRDRAGHMIDLDSLSTPGLVSD